MHSFILFHFHAFGQKVGYIFSILQKLTHDGGTDGGQFGLGKEQDGFYAGQLAVYVGNGFFVLKVVHGTNAADNESGLALAGKINGKIVIGLYLDAWAPGLSDTQIGVGYKVSSSVSMGLNYHYFATGVKLESLNRTLGSELDYQLDWKIMKDVSLSVGYSLMRGTSTMDVVKGGNHKSWQDWGWVSLNVNPTLFKK